MYNEVSQQEEEETNDSNDGCEWSANKSEECVIDKGSEPFGGCEEAFDCCWSIQKPRWYFEYEADSVNNFIIEFDSDGVGHWSILLESNINL